MGMAGTIVIEDNNPNLMWILIIIFAVTVILFNIIGIKFLFERKKTLKDVKSKIEVRHEIMLKEADPRTQSENTGENIINIVYKEEEKKKNG